MSRRALILVDIQKDFMKGGSLEVPNAEEILPVVNELLLEKEWDLVVATKDWHSEDHKSFASSHDGKNVFDVIKLNGEEQIIWPDHCVQGSIGAELHEDLDVGLIDEIIVKGTNLEVDSYSGFYNDNSRVFDSGLSDILDDTGIEEVYIVGLATDYCVKFTALDSVDLGFETYVITDGVRGLGGTGEALVEMQTSGINLTTSEAIV